MAAAAHSELSSIPSLRRPLPPEPGHGSNPSQSQRDEAFADAEPPPPYESIASDPTSTTLEANFARPYEVQDSGMFSPPSGPPPQPQQAYPSSSPSHNNNAFRPPPGPPPRPGGQSSFAPPPRHPSSAVAIPSTSLQQHGGSPSSSYPPHLDGISTFNRPALPNEIPAHALPPSTSSSSAHTSSAPRKYSPTVNPTSGQPLLYKGKLLVYNSGYYCPKCHNTGYKAYDPSAPHTRCWDKYGKPYTSMLQLSPDFDFSNPNLQKPLPNMRYTGAPPPLAATPTGGGWNGAPSPQHHNQQHQHPGYFIAGQSPPPQPVQHQPLSPVPHPGGGGGAWGPPQPQYGVFASINTPNPHMVVGRPPPGALVVAPGDPRIGGVLCNNCGGSGQTLGGGFLGLDYENCWRCRGTGRVFY